MQKKSYLCTPIIIKEPFNGLCVCVLIAFLIGLGERLVNRRRHLCAGLCPAKETISSKIKPI